MHLIPFTFKHNSPVCINSGRVKRRPMADVKFHTILQRQSSETFVELFVTGSSDGVFMKDLQSVKSNDSGSVDRFGNNPVLLLLLLLVLLLSLLLFLFVCCCCCVLIMSF